MPGLGLIGSICAIAMKQTWAAIREVAVEYLISTIWQVVTCNLTPSGPVEDAQFDSGGMCGENREVDPKTIPGSSHWAWLAGRKTRRQGGHYATPSGIELETNL